MQYSVLGKPRLPSIDNNLLYREAVSGGTVVMVNIDECLKEICDSGGCHNKLVVDEQSPVMVNTKGKSFVGVGTRIVPECQCLRSSCKIIFTQL
jgi:hypothetical protein